MTRHIRPPIARGIGGVCCAALALGLLSACGTDLPELSGEEATACSDLVSALPDNLLGHDLDERDDRTAAYDEVTVTCGVARPEDYAPTAACNEVAGVGWFVPGEQLSDPGKDLTAYALSHQPYVELVAPAAERIDGMDAALTTLAELMNEHLGEGLACL